MSVLIPDSVLDAARMTAGELYQEVAVLLFARDRLTLGQASRLAEMGQLEFQHLLASRGIEMHYGPEDLEEDIATLRSLGRL